MSEKKLEQVKIVSKEFSFQLSTEDFAQKAKEVGELHDELAAAEAVFESAKAKYKAAEGRISAEIAARVRIIQNKRENRMVECEQVHDFVRAIVYWKFNDAILGQRSMEMSERQPSLLPDVAPLKEVKNDVQVFELGNAQKV